MRSLVLCFILFGILTNANPQSTFRALLADNAASEHRDKLMLFGQFVGSWKFSGTEYYDNGRRATDRGEIHFHWVLQGRAIQDVWLETKRTDSDPKVYGTTLRFYDPKTDSWRITWIEPRLGVVRMLTGTQVRSEIVLSGQAADGLPLRWIFSDIKRHSFHWRGEKSNGKQWRIYEELWANRM